MTPWGWGESSVFSVLRDSTSLRLQNFAVKFQKVLGGESIDRACLSLGMRCPTACAPKTSGCRGSGDQPAVHAAPCDLRRPSWPAARVSSGA